MLRVGLAHLFVVLIVLLSASAFAATCTVNTTADEFNTGTDCSFREAVQSLNTGANFGGCSCDDSTNAFGTMDTVVVPAGSYDLTIPGSFEDLNEEGDVDIRVSMTIMGAGSGDDDTANTIIEMNIAPPAGNDPDERDRVLDVLCVALSPVETDNGPVDGFPDCVDGLDVTIQDLQIRDGFVPDMGNLFPDLKTGGGGIRLIDSLAGQELVTRFPPVTTATLSNVNIQNNVGGTGGGVGAFILGLTVQQGTTIHNNTARFAGGGLATLSTQPAFIDAAAVGSSLIVEDSDISSNTAGSVLEQDQLVFGFGGGLSVVGMETVNIASSTITKNKTLTGGGGLYLFMSNDEPPSASYTLDSSFHIADTLISENSANNDVAEFGALFQYNFGIGGGALILASGEEMPALMERDTISHNEAAMGGGLVYSEPRNLLSPGTLTSEVPPQLFVKNSSFFNNEANGDAFVFTECRDDFDFQFILPSQVTYNLMAGVGGGILNLGAPFALENSTVAFNRATHDGGGVANLPNLLSLIDVSVVTDYFDQPDVMHLGDMELTNVTLSLNQTHDHGGGIRNGLDRHFEQVAFEPQPDGGEYGFCAEDVRLTSDMTLQNVIAAGDLLFGQGHGTDCLTTDDDLPHGTETGTITSLGNNLFGNDIEMDCGLTKLGSDFEVGVDGAVLGLDSFTDDGTAGNGHFPVLFFSTAIDNANADVCETGTAVSGSDLQSDQIFVDRVDTPGVGQDGANFQCEIGAIEFVGTCGNGVQEDAEECDDGNASNLDACKNDCTLNVCGDGVINVGVEACENGSQCIDGTDCTGNPDACSALNDTSCAPRDNDGCSADCQPETGFNNVCGDAIIVPADGEECDDGNTVNGDGCSDQCKLEVAPLCGNGVVDAGEECDDGNTVDGDGCSSTCKEETQQQSLGGCIGGGGCIFGACTESDPNVDLSNVDLSFLSIYSARSLQESRSNTYVLLFFFLTIVVIGAVRTRLAYRRNK